jgi:hypothetical protein
MEKIVKDYFEYCEINEAEGKEEKSSNTGTYEAYVRKMLKKYGVSSPSELKADKKVEFFKALDDGWKSEAEKKGGN